MMPASNEPCKDCMKADERVEMLTKSSVFCSRWDKPVWKHDTTPRACFVPKE